MATQLTEQNKNLLTERLAELPEELQQLLSGDEVRKISSTVKERHNLSPQQDAAVENALVMVLLVLRPIDRLAENIEETASLDPNTAASVTEKLVSALPEDVAEMLRQISEEMNNEEAGSEEKSEEAVSTTIEPVASPEPAPKPPAPQPAPSQPKPAPLTASRTMSGDMARAKAQGEEKPEEEPKNNVPRFAKPLTETPRYDK